MFLSDLAGYIVASQYYINKAKTNWEEADAFCQRNGSVLAVLDSQQKIEELSAKIKSLGHEDDRFWIGLLFNASIGQFVWSTGEIASENFINSTCGINRHGSLRQLTWCYQVRHFNTTPCLVRRYCRNKLLRFGCICQPVSSKGTIF